MRLILLLAALLLASCGANPAPTPYARNAPTLEAPAWTTADTPITLENAASLRYLGRLDPPDVAATWFDSALSPDSSRLAALNVDQLAAWDLRTGSTLFYTARGDSTRVFYSPDQTELYGVQNTGTVSVYDPQTGRQIDSFVGLQPLGRVAWNAANGWLALGNSEGVIKVWDAAARQSLVTFDAHRAQIFALAFSPDGSRLASTSADHTTVVWDWRARAGLYSTGATDILRLDFMPDGSRLAQSTAINVNLWTFGAPPVALDTRGTDVLLFSGNYLLAGSRYSGLTLWDATADRLIARLPDTAGDGVSAAFSPDGALLVTATLNGGVYLWNLSAITGDQLTQAALAVNTRQIHHVEWTADGKLILLFDAGGAVYVWGSGG